MIKAIIFDCFGVLTNDAWLPFKNEHFGHDSEKFEEAGRLNVLCDSGKISYDQFTQMIAQLARLSSSTVDESIRNSVPNDALFDFIKQNLKGKYKIGILSNAASDWLSEMFNTDQLGMFDSVTLSCDIGFVKPDLRAYQASMDVLGAADPAECLFIDDQPRFIEGAQKIGMKAILFESTHQAILDIQETLQADSDS